MLITSQYYIWSFMIIRSPQMLKIKKLNKISDQQYIDPHQYQQLPGQTP